MKNIQVWSNSDLHGPVDTHYYDIDVVEDNSGLFTEKYTISRIGDSIWVEPNVAAVMRDHGNGIDISLGDNNIRLDYEQAFCLLSLLLSQTDSAVQLKDVKTLKQCQ